MQTKKTCLSLLFIASLALAVVGCVQDTDTETIDSTTPATETVAPPAESDDYGIPDSRERFEIREN